MNEPERKEDLARVHAMDAMDRGEENLAQLKRYVREGSALVRHKALETMKTVMPFSDWPWLEAFVRDRANGEAYRLRALDVWAHLLACAQRDPQTAAKCGEGIQAFGRIFHDPDPLFAKGVVAGLGRIGGEQALSVLFDLCVQPAGRLVKPELFEEAIDVASGAMEGFEAFLQERMRTRPKLAIYLRDYRPARRDMPRFGIYPANDYMALQVRALGMDYKRFKYLVESE